MNTIQQNHFQSLYQQHVNALHRQGKAAATIDAYSRAIRCFRHLNQRATQGLLCRTRSQSFLEHRQARPQWPTVFYKYVLGKTWTWVDIVKPPIPSFDKSSQKVT